MVELEGDSINLRGLVLEDLTFLYTIENDESLWELSQIQTPFSKDVLQKYLETVQNDLEKLKQLRLVITSKANEPLGFIDLFDFDSLNKHAGVSIVITELHRRNGYGKDALTALMNYSFNNLGLQQLYSNVLEDNNASIRLFESLGFEKVGLKKKWRYFKGRYKNEYLFQFINHVS
jgi:diamine N-acetyltransferase